MGTSIIGDGSSKLMYVFVVWLLLFSQLDIILLVFLYLFYIII